MGALIFLGSCLCLFFLKLIVTCRLCVIHVKEDIVLMYRYTAYMELDVRKRR